MITETDPAGVQPSKGFAENTKDLVTRLLPESGIGRDRLLAVKEVAERLGLCGATVYRLCDRGELSHVRIAAAIRVRPADLAAFIASRRWPPRSISL